MTNVRLDRNDHYVTTHLLAGRAYILFSCRRQSCIPSEMFQQLSAQNRRCHTRIIIIIIIIISFSLRVSPARIHLSRCHATIVVHQHHPSRSIEVLFRMNSCRRAPAVRVAEEYAVQACTTHSLSPSLFLIRRRVSPLRLPSNMHSTSREPVTWRATHSTNSDHSISPPSSERPLAFSWASHRRRPVVVHRPSVRMEAYSPPYIPLMAKSRLPLCYFRFDERCAMATIGSKRGAACVRADVRSFDDQQ